MGMRSLFLFAALVGALIGGGYAAARCAFGGDDKAAPPTVDVSPGSPGATADAFAKAWTAGNTNALYLLVSANAQRQFSPEVFSDIYDRFASELTQLSLTAVARDARPGSAQLDVKLVTAYFGDFEYSTTLNLSQTPGGWAVDWDPSDIHPEMVNGREFKSVIQRPVRGTIYDRAGGVLAVTQDIRYVGLNRSLINDQAALKATLLNFGFSEADVDGALASSAGSAQRVRVGPVPPAKDDEATNVLRNIPGIVLYFESQRVHPLGAAAAHVVGYTREFTAEELAARRGEGLRAGDRVGATGLEASQEGTLAGGIGAELRVVDDSATVVKVLMSRPFRPGGDVHTTLDSAALRTAYDRLGSRAGAAVVIDPTTNAVLALNSSPSFDPDAFERNDAAALARITSAPNGPLANRATTGLYSAGSTFKLVTGAAGLLYGGYKVTDRLECGATWDGVDPPRKNWEGAQGLLTIAEGLMRSCNPVFYQIGLTLYNDTDGALSQTARLFGYGAPTGIAALSEEAGLVPDAAQKRAKSGLPWFPGDEVNLAIGQGDLLITPLQLANAYTAFINRQLRTPRLLAEQASTPKDDIPLAADQWALLMNGLKLVTSAKGTASAAFSLAGYTDFAGKSGTAEDVGTQQHVLFVAMSPASAPKAIAAVVLDEGQSGSIEAGPIARDIVLAALH
jgi:penicillin-binding protein 2